MRNKLGPGTTLSYCTNVFPGNTLTEIADAIEEVFPSVKQGLSPHKPLGLGICIPPLISMADHMIFRWWAKYFFNMLRGKDPNSVRRFEKFLDQSNMEILTCNAFSFHPFHETTVKYSVYEPDWTSEMRLQHTNFAVLLLTRLAFGSESASISTLPIGWPSGFDDTSRIRESGERLREFVELLELIQDDEGDVPVSAPHITLDLEPEPGCILDTADDVIAFFDEHLPDELHRKYIGVCHDVCHTAVMFEDQRDVLRRYAEAGIRVNKVQISSALDVDVATLGVETAIQHLKQFDEPRYLHQTGILHDAADPKSFELIEDLPEAIERLEAGETPDRLRVHFHVPVYLDSIGPLGTTNNQIADAVAAAREYHDTKHFEVETYAWGVLPDHLKRETLAEGIADELKWVLKTSGV